MNRRHALARLAAACGTAAAAPAVFALGDKTVTIVVPYAPGGTTDLLGRLLAQRMAPLAGRNFIVENKPGAGSGIGAGYVAHAAADGSTLLASSWPALVLPLRSQPGFSTVEWRIEGEARWRVYTTAPADAAQQEPADKPRVQVVHVGGASTRQVRPEAIRRSHEGLEQFYAKYYRGRMPGWCYAALIGAIRLSGRVRAFLAGR